MSYKISSVDSQKVILGRNSSSVTAGVFITIGSIVLLVGVGFNVFSTTWEMPFLIFRIVLPAFGLFFALAGLYIPKQVRSTIPEQLTFDHQKGALVVQMDKTKNEYGYIRYDEIAGINIHVEARSSGKSTHYYYHIYVQKIDGGEWFLLEFSSKSKAEQVLQELRAAIPLSNPYTVQENISLSKQIEKTEGANKTIIHWQNKVSIMAPLGIVAFSIVFLGILSIVFFIEDEPDVFMLVVAGFIFLVFLLVMTITIKNVIKDAFTRYAVSVDSENLVYYEFNNKNGIMRNNKTIPLSTIEGIVYTFAPTKNTFNPGIKILTSADVIQQKHDKENPIEALKNLFSGNKPITLSIKALNPVECLQLENWLQQLILTKSNVAVK